MRGYPGVAVAVVSVFFLVAAAGCSDRTVTGGAKGASVPGGGGESAPSAVAATAACGASDASLCTFAADIETALQKGDAGPLLAALVPEKLTCPAQDPPASDPLAAVCRGHAGQPVDAYRTGMRNAQAAYANKETLGAQLAGIAAVAQPALSDDYGTGGLLLHTVGTPGQPDCQACAALIFSWVQPDPTQPERLARQVLELDAKPAGSSWQVTAALAGPVLPGEAPALLAGGQLEGRTYRWFHSGQEAPAGLSTIGTGIYFGLEAQVANTGGDCVNYRVAPGKAGQVTDCIDQGKHVPILSGPQEADGLRWWKVQSPNSALQPGWIAAQFLSAAP